MYNHNLENTFDDISSKTAIHKLDGLTSLPDPCNNCEAPFKACRKSNRNTSWSVMNDCSWLMQIKNLDCETLAQVATSDKSAFVHAFHILGEPFLLALCEIDEERMIRDQGSLVDPDTGRQVPLYLARTSAGLFHEVRLSSWACSCAQFAFAAYGDLHPSKLPPQQAQRSIYWGGTQTRESTHVPYCKHLLAGVLLEYGGPLFSGRCKKLPVDQCEDAVK